MVRTKADGGARKAVAAKAPRKSLGAGGGGGPAGGSAILSPNAAAKSKYAGGNVVCPRPTPGWQKGIMNFMLQSPTKKKDKENDDPVDDAGAGSSKGEIKVNEANKKKEQMEDIEEEMNEGDEKEKEQTEDAEKETNEGEEKEMEQTEDAEKETNEGEEKEKEQTEDDEKEGDEKETEETMDEGDKEDETQVPESSTSKFKKNNCIDDSDDDD